MIEGKIRIEPLAFEEILRSVYETLRVECSGILFGQYTKTNRRMLWEVESVHPMQIADRYPNSISIDAHQLERVPAFGLSTDCVGMFHLHTTSRKQIRGIRGTDLGRVFLQGRHDKSRLLEHKGAEIVVGLRPVQLAKKLSQDNPFLISGYIQDKGRGYRFDIGGYYHNGRIRRAQMLIPRGASKLI